MTRPDRVGASATLEESGHSAEIHPVHEPVVVWWYCNVLIMKLCALFVDSVFGSPYMVVLPCYEPHCS